MRIKKEIINDGLLGICELTETSEELLKEIHLSKEEMAQYLPIKNEVRKKHWLATRILLHALLNKRVTIQYDTHGKPFLLGNKKHISISHSGKFVAVFVSTQKEIGIDIEIINPKIKRIAHKFLNNTEKDYLLDEFEVETLHVIWGAKEALYKLYGKKKLIFEDDLLIEPFEYDREGIICGHIKKGAEKRYHLHYRTIEDYMLVYVVSRRL